MPPVVQSGKVGKLNQAYCCLTSNWFRHLANSTKQCCA